MDLARKSIALHKKLLGKISVQAKTRVRSARELALVYTPGVAAVCEKIASSPRAAFDYTLKWNAVAVVSDGSRVLGLGDIGPLAALPVMEGKALLFKELGGVDAFPICLNTRTADEFVAAVKAIAPSFGGINLEDIESPKCFEVEERLARALDIPVFHDDQHGTAVVALAGLLNSLRLARKDLRDAKIVLNGVGAAGTAIAKLLAKAGARNVVAVDRKGALWRGMNGLPKHMKQVAEATNPGKEKGFLKDVIQGADAFVGVSAPNVLTPKMVRSMNERAIVFALANPLPEIEPRTAKRAGAFVVATGRSDFPNQVNNVLGFPGIFRGLLDARVRRVNDEIKLAAAHAIAGVVKPRELKPEYVIPRALDKRVAPAVAEAVLHAARETGVARK